MESAIKSNQIQSLTGLRGYAILTVMFYHLIGMNHVLMNYGFDVGIGRYAHWGVLNLMLSYCWYGVDVFFVLSGFVISYNYLDTLALARPFSKQTLWYMAVRVVRLYPAYVLALLCLLAMWKTGMWESIATNPLALPYHFTLTYAWWFYPQSYGQTWNLPAWSLSVEFFSYYLFPFMAIGLAALKKPGMCVALVFLLSILIQGLDRPILGMHALLSGLSYFSLGCIAYRLYCMNLMERYGPLLAGGSLAVLIISTALAGNLVLCLASFSLFGLVLGLAHAEQSRFVSVLFRNRFILFTGTISYSIYIIQFPCFIFLNWLRNYYFPQLDTQVQDSPALLVGVIALVLIFIFGWATALHDVIEKPIVRFFKQSVRKP